MAAVRVLESVHHRLGFALRFDDHFLRDPVAEELDVALAPGLPLPLRSVGAGRRHDDGTYRFPELPPATYDVRVASPSGRWTAFGAALQVVVPLANPTTPVVRDLWPTPRASVAVGMTAVRGRLAGPGASGAVVEIAEAGKPFDGRFTRGDGSGEFLYPYPRAATPAADGTISLTVRVAGGARTVDAVTVVTAAGDQPFPSGTFKCLPARQARIRLAFH